MLGPSDLILPPIVLLSSIATLAFTITSLSLTGRLEGLTFVRSLKQSWFKHFWWWFGPGTKTIFARDVRPLLAQARGVVLEIGPASGIWMQDFLPAVSEGSITKIYGVEPNVTFHDQLKAASKKNGMEDIYQPLPAYSHELERYGVKKGSIDTIVTVHVLCSVGPQLDSTVKDLFDYLKPGGQWLVYEHVAARYSIARAWQRVNNIVWGNLLDGCHLLRDTEQALRNAGEYDENNLRSDPQDGHFQALPHLMGRLVKKA